MAVNADELKVGQVVEMVWPYHWGRTIHVLVASIYHAPLGGIGVEGYRVGKTSGKQVGSILHSETAGYVIRIIKQPEEASDHA